MRLLFLGDIVGRGARVALQQRLREMRSRFDVDLVVANGENASSGKGIKPDAFEELLDAGVDVVTTGNHIWQHRQILDVLARDSRLLRPANFPVGSPGSGVTRRRARDGTEVVVVNLIGRVFLGNSDCPFLEVDRILEAEANLGALIFVDMHAEATSEKVAMGWHLDGRVAAVAGTHTHIQTSDERILPGGTGYITDVGMCGPIDSVIGMKTEQVLYRFRTQRPVHFEVARGPLWLQGALFDLDPTGRRCRSVERVRIEVRP